MGLMRDTRGEKKSPSMNIFHLHFMASSAMLENLSQITDAELKNQKAKMFVGWGGGCAFYCYANLKMFGQKLELAESRATLFQVVSTFRPPVPSLKLMFMI